MWESTSTYDGSQANPSDVWFGPSSDDLPVHAPVPAEPLILKPNFLHLRIFLYSQIRQYNLSRRTQDLPLKVRDRLQSIRSRKDQKGRVDLNGRGVRRQRPWSKL